MKQFKFKLEKILKYRKLLKDAQQGKLVRAEEARNQTLAELKELDLEREELYQAIFPNKLTSIHQRGSWCKLDDYDTLILILLYRAF
jgi:hypothetical protein